MERSIRMTERSPITQVNMTRKELHKHKNSADVQHCCHAGSVQKMGMFEFRCEVIVLHTFTEKKRMYFSR